MQLPNLTCTAVLCALLALAMPMHPNSAQAQQSNAGTAAGQAGATAPPNDNLSLCKNGQDDAVTLPACEAVARDETRASADRAFAYANAGYSKLVSHELDVAEDYFSRALALDSNSDMAYSGRSDVEFAKGDYDQAIADANKAIAMKPAGHPEAYLLLGTLADRNGDHDARIAFMNKAIALAPSYAEAYAGRGNGYMAENKYDLALADFSKAIALKPDLGSILQPNFEIIYIERGGEFVRAADYGAAIGDYSRALQLNPRNTRALNDRGDAYNMTGDYDKAVADLTKAIESNPSYPYAYSNRGVSYFKLGQNDQALADLDKAIELNDQASSTYFVRGEVYQGKSDLKSALADYQKALDLTPADDPARANIQSAIDAVKK